MAARIDKASPGEESPTSEDLHQWFRDQGMEPREWGNAPGDSYGWHAHDYHKVLFCVSGSIVFHTRTNGDLQLEAGDRLDVEPGTDHAATVGSEGVQCIEAAR